MAWTHRSCPRGEQRLHARPSLPEAVTISYRAPWRLKGSDLTTVSHAITGHPSVHRRNRVVSFRYDVAFSFAGEDRAIVEPIADAVRAGGLRIFYDKYEEAYL